MTVKNSINLGQVTQDVGKASPEALKEAADYVGKIAAVKAPLLTGAALKKANDQRRSDPGALKRSMYTRIVDDNTAEVGFTEFYAAWQHERLDYNHEDGQSKFLEEPILTEGDNVLDLLAARIREALQQ